jgi:Arc-like DNA binding domain
MMPRNHTPHLRAAERGVRTPVTRTLRFDEGLRQQLEEAAKRSVRSVNSEIIFRLLSTFRREATN